MTHLLKCALWFAEQGHPVFPLRPMTKVPATPRGFKDATTNPAQIEEWWTFNYNIGLPTGHRFDVLDIDLNIEWSEAVENQFFNDGALAIVTTPRGGTHIYLPPGTSPNKAGMLPGVDWRGPGGYVVAPPSRSDVGEWKFVDFGGMWA